MSDSEMGSIVLSLASNSLRLCYLILQTPVVSIIKDMYYRNILSSVPDKNPRVYGLHELFPRIARPLFMPM